MFSPREPSRPHPVHKSSAVILWLLLAVNLALFVYNLLMARFVSAGYTFALSVAWGLLAASTRRRLSLRLNLLLFASIVAALVLIFIRYKELVRPR